MATVPKGKKVTIGGKTYRPGEELPEQHAKLLSIPTPTKTIGNQNKDKGK